MAMLGLDPARVNSEVKAPFHKCGGEIDGIIKTLTHVVNNNLGNGGNVAWSGADAMQFKNDWASHQAKLRDVVTMLNKAVATLDKNIQAQESTSSGGSGTFA